MGFADYAGRAPGDGAPGAGAESPFGHRRAALLLAAPAAAQDTGVVAGTVVDSTAQIVPGATVTLANENTGDVRTVVSNERGEFAFRAVPPGSYTVKVELAGFRTIEREVGIRPGRTTDLDVNLER